MRPEGSTARMGFLVVGQRAPPHQLGSLEERCKLPQRGPWRSPENLDFGAFWDLRNHARNGQLAFESGTISESAYLPSALT